MIIGTIARLLGGSTIAAWLVVAMLGLTAAGGAYWWIDHQGYQRAATEWTVKYQGRELALAAEQAAKRRRQADANTAAKANELARIKEMNAELSNLQSQIKEHANEADQDPDRDLPGLGADGVRRLNTIRRAK